MKNDIMRILLIAFIAFGICGLFVSGFIVGRKWGGDHGIDTGKIMGKYEIIEILKTEFGNKIVTEDLLNSKILFSVKATSVYVVNRNGEKTIRIAE